MRDLTGNLTTTLDHAATAAGQPVATSAIRDFAATWSMRLMSLAQLVAGLGDGLAVSATAYESTDEAAASTIATTGRRL